MGAILFEGKGTAVMPVGAGTTFSWSHKSSGGPNTVAMVWGFLQFDPTYPTYESSTHTVTYGGTSMTSLVWKYMNNARTFGWLELFYLFDPPSGTQTITVTTTSSANAYNAGVSVSYQNVASLGTPVTAYGQGVTEQITVTGGTADSVAVAGFCNDYTLAVSTTGLRASTLSNGMPVDVADSIMNGGSNAFTSTAAGTRNWAAVGVALQPIPASKMLTMF